MTISRKIITFVRRPPSCILLLIVIFCLYFFKTFFNQCGFWSNYKRILKETFSGTPCIPPDNFYADLKFVFVMFTFVTSWHWAKLPPLFGVSGIAPEIKIICRQCIFDFDHHGPGSPSGLRQLFPSGPRLEEKP